MKSNSKEVKSIDDYINLFSDETKSKLELIRKAIQRAAPKSVEIISYGMPAFRQNKTLLYFAAYKNHIGFYPTASPIRVFNKELQIYKTSKGAIQFPLDKKLPLTLISKITRYRVKEVQKTFKTKKENLK